MSATATRLDLAWGTSTNKRPMSWVRLCRAIRKPPAFYSNAEPAVHWTRVDGSVVVSACSLRIERKPESRGNSWGTVIRLSTTARLFTGEETGQGHRSRLAGGPEIDSPVKARLPANSS